MVETDTKHGNYENISEPQTNRFFFLGGYIHDLFTKKWSIYGSILMLFL